MKILSFKTAVALAQLGLVLPTVNVYVVWTDVDVKLGSDAIMLKTAADDMARRSTEKITIIPAPDFEELWPVLPFCLTIDGQVCGLHLQARSLLGAMIAEYYHWPLKKSYLASDTDVGLPAVEYAGTLLLKILQRGYVPVDRLNKNAALIAQSPITQR